MECNNNIFFGSDYFTGKFQVQESKTNTKESSAHFLSAFLRVEIRARVWVIFEVNFRARIRV